MDFTPHEKLIDKLFDDHELLSNEQYITNVLTKRVELLTELTHSLHVDEIQMPAWKTFSETIVIKMCFHVSSLFLLFHGTELPLKLNQTKTIVFDEPSIYALFRTITECYLTFFYLFIDNIEEDEKWFRFIIYEYSGLKQRQTFNVTMPEYEKKKLDDAEQLKNLRTKIEESKFFKVLSSKQQRRIIDGIQARLNSWKELLFKANLRTGYSSNLYGFKSSYSHSEYLSLLQIKSSSYGYKPDSGKKHFVLFVIHMLICRTVIDLAKIFPSIKSRFERKDKDLIIETEFLSVLLST